MIRKKKLPSNLAIRYFLLRKLSHVQGKIQRVNTTGHLLGNLSCTCSIIILLLLRMLCLYSWKILLGGTNYRVQCTNKNKQRREFTPRIQDMYDIAESWAKKLFNWGTFGLRTRQGHGFVSLCCEKGQNATVPTRCKNIFTFVACSFL